MKEKNGFTLIELLAVIIILAVIALITTPIIINVIEKARKEAFIDSAYGILDAGKIYYVSKLSDENQFAGKTFDFTKEEDVKELKLGGEAPKGGTLTLDNKGNATLSIYNDKWCVTKTEENSKVEVRELKDGNCVIESGSKAAQTIIDNGIVESGEGLYKNPDTTGGGYVFKGSDPNNYLIFDNKCWQLISVEDNGQVKIIYYGDTNNGTCERTSDGTGSIGNIVWNGTEGSYINDWNNENTVIRTTLESLSNGGSYNGFSISSLDKVENHTWNVGTIYNHITSWEESSPMSLQELLNQEVNGGYTDTKGPFAWRSKVGLINVSDYVKSSGDSECMKESWTYNSNKAYFSDFCKDSNYLSKAYSGADCYWTLNTDRMLLQSDMGNTDKNVAIICKTAYNSYALNDLYLPSASNAIRPVLYLKNNVKITGNGTASQPFVVS